MMLYYPVQYDSIVSFIQDSSKYLDAGMEGAYMHSLGTLYSFLGNYEKADVSLWKGYSQSIYS